MIFRTTAKAARQEAHATSVRPSEPAATELRAAHSADSRFAHDFSKIPVRAPLADCESGTSSSIALRRNATAFSPGMETPAPELAVKANNLAATLTYRPTIVRGDLALSESDFGATLPQPATIRPFFREINGEFVADAVLNFEIDYNVRNRCGPHNQDDISSDDDPDITSGNYRKIVTDLLPNYGDVKGRSPRENYWCEDLTERHELFHAGDHKTAGENAVQLVQSWLRTQTASNKDELTDILRKARTLFDASEAADPLVVKDSASEERAYADGAPLYESRAKAIQAKGDRGEYK